MWERFVSVHGHRGSDASTDRDSPRKNFYLSILRESDNSVDYEMCSSDHGRLRCVRFESVRSATTALSGESGATIWRRSDRYRKGSNPTFCKTSACYSAEINAVSAANTQAVAWVTRGFSLVFPESIEPTHGMKASCPTNPSETWRRGREWSRRERRDIDEARRVSCRATANQSNRRME